MEFSLSAGENIQDAELILPGSKSISNRLLILQALFPQIQIENLSGSDDTKSVQRALTVFNDKIPALAGIVDVSHAGTAMRFLTAYFSIQEGKEVVLTGSSRMKERPIGVLVESLRELGADISYMEKKGFPPLLIKGRKPAKSKTRLRADVSSQFVSALMLIAPVFPNGLEIVLEKKTVSLPYIQMTASLLKEIGVEPVIEADKIKIPHTGSVTEKTITVESDWSSASYFFSLLALRESGKISLGDFHKNSIQGDSVLPEIYAQLGVETTFTDRKIILKNKPWTLPKSLDLDLSSTPDLAQTIAVTCLGLGVPCNLSGLQTLKIKETDRLSALKTELEKFGAKVVLTQNSLEMEPPKKPQKNVSVKTYNDHRMAMAFAPLATKTKFSIKNPDVVSKSYPTFWKDLEKLGLKIG